MATMRDRDWDRVQHFRPGEFSRPSVMNRELILLLDAYRAELGRRYPGARLVVSSSARENGGGVVNRSMHRPDDVHGVRAVDVVPRGVSVVNAYLVAERFGFGGIGLYYRPAFLHLDNRTRDEGAPARWARWGRGESYVALDAAFVEQLQLAERAGAGAADPVLASFPAPLLGALAVVVLLSRQFD